MRHASLTDITHEGISACIVDKLHGARAQFTLVNPRDRQSISRAISSLIDRARVQLISNQSTSFQISYFVRRKAWMLHVTGREVGGIAANMMCEQP